MAASTLAVIRLIQEVDAGVVDAGDVAAEHLRLHDVRDGLEQTDAEVPVAVERVGGDIPPEPLELVGLTVNRQRVFALALDQVRGHRHIDAAHDGERLAALGGDGVAAAALAAELLAALEVHDDLRRHVLDTLVLLIAHAAHLEAAVAARALIRRHRRLDDLRLSLSRQACAA